MSSKEQTHSNNAESAKQKSPQFIPKNLDIVDQQQSHSATLIQRARLDPSALTPNDVQQLQRSVGNQAIGRLLAKTTQRQLLTVQRDWLGDIGDFIGSAANTVGDWIDDVDTKSRNLSKSEIAMAREIFGNTIDYSLVSLERNTVYNLTLPIVNTASSKTLGNTIALTDDKFDGKNLKLNAEGQSTLMHELAHVWQYQNQGWEYAPAALWAQAMAWIKTGSRNAAYKWEILDSQGIPWEDWNPEAQAQAVEDYNFALRQVKSGRGTMSNYKVLSKAWPYIEKMRYLPPGLGDFPVTSGDHRNT